MLFDHWTTSSPTSADEIPKLESMPSILTDMTTSLNSILSVVTEGANDVESTEVLQDVDKTSVAPADSKNSKKVGVKQTAVTEMRDDNVTTGCSTSSTTEGRDGFEGFVRFEGAADDCISALTYSDVSEGETTAAAATKMRRWNQFTKAMTRKGRKSPTLDQLPDILEVNWSRHSQSQTSGLEVSLEDSTSIISTKESSAASETKLTKKSMGVIKEEEVPDDCDDYEEEEKEALQQDQDASLSEPRIEKEIKGEDSTQPTVTISAVPAANDIELQPFAEYMKVKGKKSGENGKGILSRLSTTVVSHGRTSAQSWLKLSKKGKDEKNNTRCTSPLAISTISSRKGFGFPSRSGRGRALRPPKVLAAKSNRETTRKSNSESPTISCEKSSTSKEAPKRSKSASRKVGRRGHRFRSPIRRHRTSTTKAASRSRSTDNSSPVNDERVNQIPTEIFITPDRSPTPLEMFQNVFSNFDDIDGEIGKSEYEGVMARTWCSGGVGTAADGWCFMANNEVNDGYADDDFVVVNEEPIEHRLDFSVHVM